jgi:hypothetical protein
MSKLCVVWHDFYPNLGHVLTGKASAAGSLLEKKPIITGLVQI